MNQEIMRWESHLNFYLSKLHDENQVAGYDTKLRLNLPAIDDDLIFIEQFWGVNRLPDDFLNLYRLTNGLNLHFRSGHVHPLVAPIDEIPNRMQRCHELAVVFPLIVGRFLPFIDYFDHPYGYYHDQHNEIDGTLWTMDVDTIGYSVANPDLPLSNCFYPTGKNLWEFFT
jgi:hypothetical protein